MLIEALTNPCTDTKPALNIKHDNHTRASKKGVLDTLHGLSTKEADMYFKQSKYIVEVVFGILV
jgi:hypothetical protein